MSRPIEEGCLAIVMGGEDGYYNAPKNVGKLVRVGKFIGSHPQIHPEYSDLWEVDVPIAFSFGYHFYFQSERYLQRIDDTDTETTTATTDMPAEVGV